jgi:hypothetical protein
MSYATLTPAIVKAIQELNLKVDTLQLANGTTSTNVFDSFRNWLGDVGNGIGDIFAQRGHFKELCIGESGNETCLTKQQIDNLIQGNTVSSVIGSPVPTTDSGGSNDQANSVSDTDSVGSSITNSGDSSPDVPNATTPDTSSPMATE